MKLTLRELIHVLKGQLILGDPRSVAQRAVVDSRLVESGDLFFALPGEKTDGHNFAFAACHLGAAAVVVSRINWIGANQHFSTAVILVEDPLTALKALAQHLRQNFKGPVIGITGSNGKTTTKQMMASVMSAKGNGLATKGNLNSQIGLPLVISELNGDHGWLVLEMGASEPGHIASLAEIARPTVGILTSIGAAHLKTFGSLQKVAESKWELLESLPADGCGIVPWGEPTLEPLIRTFSKRLVFFGEDSSCPVRATAVEMRETPRFTLLIGTQSAKVSLPM